MMFNNPFFNQQDYQDNSKASQSSVKGRPSVQEVLDKYDSNTSNQIKARNSLGQGVRFTFQKPQPQQNFQGSSPETRGTFGGGGATQPRMSMKQKTGDQPRESYQQQLLKSIDESNLSKVLSEFSIYSEDDPQQDQKVVPQNKVFVNPLGIPINNVTIQSPRINQMQERVTFGEGFLNQFAPKKEVSAVDKSYMGEDDLFGDMSVLRDKVLGLLQAYSNETSERDSTKLKDVKQKVQKDAQQIAHEYSQIIDRVNQTDISALTNTSFETNPKKERELNMMFGLVEEFLSKFDSSRAQPLDYSKIIQQKQSQVSPPQNAQSAYSRAPLAAVNTRLQQPNANIDISVMPSFPAIDDTFYQNTSIHVDKLHAKLTKLKQLLMHELDQANLPLTKSILADMIYNLNEILTANDVNTVKTVVYKIEMGIKTLNQEDQGSVKLYNYMAKAIKATNKRLEEIQQPHSKTLKRKFFDISLKHKNLLPPGHPKRNVMVSLMFDEFMESGRPESEMEAFITSKFN